MGFLGVSKRSTVLEFSHVKGPLMNTRHIGSGRGFVIVKD